jgi:RNA polymerase sigma factor (sigma-70 family)
MCHPKNRDSQSAGSNNRFASTSWSIVVAAGRPSSPDSQQALESLCRTYWYPLYAYVRRRVSSVHDAQDLTQGFFASLLERNTLGAADCQRGRFRSFLLTAFRNFLADEWDRAKAQKRGDGLRAIPLDFATAESRASIEPADKWSPEKTYEREWALTLLDLVLNRLREEFIAKGKQRHFETLKQFLGENEPGSFDVAAKVLGISSSAVKVAAHRMRRRYRELLRSEIAETVAEPEDVDDELRTLRANLG